MGNGATWGLSESPEHSTILQKNLSSEHNCYLAVHPGLKSKSSDKKLSSVPVYEHIIKKLTPQHQRLVRHACSHGTSDGSSATRVLKDNAGISNPFVAACSMAFDKHLPLTLRPQHFWLCIAQGVAMHIEGNSHELRDRFVKHMEGKMELELDVTAEAVRGFTQEHWEGVVVGFDDLLRKHTNEGVVERLGCSDFSNSTLEEKVASSMTCMDAMKSYFNFKCSTKCGFPSIRMEGTVEDWRLLRVKAEELVNSSTLPKFALEWLRALTGVLDRLVLAREGEGKHVDVQFWESFVKRGGSRGSGAHTWISGWVNVFFPLKTPGKANRFCVEFEGGDQYNKYVKSLGGGMDPECLGLDLDDFPSGLSSAPVTLDDHPLDFRSGFLGVEQDLHDGGLKPVVGWFVASGASTSNSSDDQRASSAQTKEIATRIGAVIPLLDESSFSLSDLGDMISFEE